MATIKVRFDGQVFVPEQPVSLPSGFRAEISILIAPPVSARIAGLHPHAIQTTADFDAPLPDEFWLGNS